VAECTGGAEGFEGQRNADGLPLDFTTAMLDQAVKNSGLEGIFEDHLSTDRVRVFKHDRRAYRMAMSALGLRKEEIAFAAFGGWDAVGAKWFRLSYFLGESSTCCGRRAWGDSGWSG
jgi:hypothetical protein